MQNNSSLTLIAIQAALKAGDVLRKGFGYNHKILTKPGRQNFVTEYDYASEELIISLIRASYPAHNILAEESGYTDHSNQSILWVIDPLDGTRNFVNHIPCFAISIAAYEKEIGLCGVIYQPMTQELFVAEKGKGAYLNGHRLKVSEAAKLEEALIIAELPYDNALEPKAAIQALMLLNEKGTTLRSFGSSVLSLAYVAAGNADAFWKHKLYPWDLAAGKILVEEAGGAIIHYDNQKNSFHTPSSIVAANKMIQPQLLKTLLLPN